MYKIVVHVFKPSQGKRNKVGDIVVYPPLFIERREIKASSDEAAAAIGRKVAGTIANFEAETAVDE